MLATILASHGQRIALIDRQTHPRFAIGESSTPLADGLLRWLGETYKQPAWIQLSTYGDWKTHHPTLGCGLKRGFTYMRHPETGHIGLADIEDSSLLVAASASDARGDTHWYRSDVDHFFYDQALDTGVVPIAGHELTNLGPGSPHRISLSDTRTNEVTEVLAETVIDASGQTGVTTEFVPTPNRTGQLNTNTRSVFAHYRGVVRFFDHLGERGYDKRRDPFRGDDAAVHHLVADGWMWNLRFDNDVTSVGYTTTGDRELPSLETVIRHSRDLSSVFRHAEISVPETSTQRLQRYIGPVIANRIWMLPATAVTLDPLHSTGIAMQLAGVARIASQLIHACVDDKQFELDYTNALHREVVLLDDLVSTAYAVMSDFGRFTTACMLFFVAAIASEERLMSDGFTARQPLYESDNSDLTQVLHASCGKLRSDQPTGCLTREITAAIHPFNHAGLLDPDRRNRYAYTATK